MADVDGSSAEQPPTRRRRRSVVGQTGARFGGSGRQRRLGEAAERQRMAQQRAAELEAAMAATPPPDPQPAADEVERLDQPDLAGDERGDPTVLVRPYAWTRGRTGSAYVFELETLISANHRRMADLGPVADSEHLSVAELCAVPCSVAELSAKLSVPLGVVRVLLGDMAELGVINVHRTAGGDGNRPDLELMSQVLAGLRRL